MILILSLAIFLYAPAGFALDVVATIKEIKIKDKSGYVDVIKKKDNKKVSGIPGMILNDKDWIKTGGKSKVTIEFRDGSVIRLFQHTEFLIERSKESEKGSRRFLHNFKLKLGSFWGKFTKKRQKTVIRTPTATCGIKGTTVAFSEKSGKLDVSLSTGKVSIENESEMIDLEPGKMAQKITRRGSIRDKVSDLPYLITIKPDNNRIELPKMGNKKELYFTLQLVNNKTNQNISRPGSVYISLRLDKIKFRQDIRLNSRGYARVKAIVRPFTDKEDYGNGNVEIIAVMDGEKYLDTGAGHTTLTYDVPGSIKTIKIKARSGNFQ